MAEIEASVYPNAVLRNGHVILRVDGPVAMLGYVLLGLLRVSAGALGVG